jgi:hypothetical protein
MILRFAWSDRRVAGMLVPGVRRVASRVVRSVFLTLALCALVGQARAADLDAMVGFGVSVPAAARYRMNAWVPITVYITGAGVAGVGQLQLAVASGSSRALYTRRVPLHEGPLDEVVGFTVLLRDQDVMSMMRNVAPEMHLQLLMDGRKLAEKTVVLPIPVQQETFNVLALTRDGAGFNLLTQKKLGLVHRHFNPSNINSYRFGGMSTPTSTTHGSPEINPDASLQVLYTAPRALPTTGQGYDMIDAVILADQPLESLTEDQIAALHDYVLAGGLLIISGGSDVSRLKSQAIADLLPIDPAPAQTVASLPDLQARYNSPLPMAQGVALTEGPLKPGAEAIFPAGSQNPLIVGKSFGLGTVVFTRFDLLAPEIRGWQAAPSFLRDLLRSGSVEVSAQRMLRVRANGQGGASQPLADALAGPLASNTPAFLTIALFIGTYLVLLIPLNYLILKRLDRRELTWITAPAIILGFTVVSYVMALSFKGGALSAHRAVAIETSAGSDQAAGYGVMTVYSPRRSTYDISFGPEDDPNSPYRRIIPHEAFVGGEGYGGDELNIVQDKTTTLQNVPIRLWDKRSFCTPVSLAMGGPVQVDVRPLDRMNAELTITNRTRYNLSQCGIATPDKSFEVPDLPAGGSAVVRISFPVRSTANNILLPTVPDTTSGKQHLAPTAAVLQNRIQQALFQACTSSATPDMWQSTDGEYGASAAVLTAWFKDPVLDVRINGSKPEGEETNLLCVHLAPPSTSGIYTRWTHNPFLHAPVLNLEDEEPAGAKRVGTFK